RTKVLIKMVRGFINTAMGKNLRKVLYPRGGMSRLCNALAAEFEQMGGSIVFDAADVRLVAEGNRIRRVLFKDQAIENPEHLIWTGSIHELAGQMGISMPDLPLIKIILGFIKTNRKLPLPPYLYTYYAQPDIVFNRAYFPRLISADLVPEGADAICVEISPQGKNGDTLDEAGYKNAIFEGLEKAGLCSREEVLDISLMEVPEAYPVYPLDYYDKLQSLWKEVRAFENLWSIGRSAQFYYNNMARAMGVSLDLVDHLTRSEGS
ncbi:MAG: hypothetical protein ABIK28_15120, partial [Planctomycetota bacterium]